MLHFDMKKFDSHPSTNDIPFKKVDVTYPGAPVMQSKATGYSWQWSFIDELWPIKLIQAIRGSTSNQTSVSILLIFKRKYK